MSAGIGVFPHNGDTAAIVMAAADEALYEENMRAGTCRSRPFQRRHRQSGLRGSLSCVKHHIVQLGARGRDQQVRHARRYLHIVSRMQCHALATGDAAAPHLAGSGVPGTGDRAAIGQRRLAGQDIHVMRPVGMNLGLVAGVAAGGVFDIVILMVAPKAVLAPGPGLSVSAATSFADMNLNSSAGWLCGGGAPCAWTAGASSASAAKAIAIL